MSVRFDGPYKSEQTRSRSNVNTVAVPNIPPKTQGSKKQSNTQNKNPSVIMEISSKARNKSEATKSTKRFDRGDFFRGLHKAIAKREGKGIKPEGPSYRLSASSPSVNEGSSIQFFLTTNFKAGTQISYQLTGISSRDIQGGFLSGSTTIGNDGIGTINLNLLADNLTEGPETLNIKVMDQSLSVFVNDTSQKPSTDNTATVSTLNLSQTGRYPNSTIIGNNQYIAYIDQTGKSKLDIVKISTGDRILSNIEILPNDSSLLLGSSLELKNINENQFIVMGHAYSNMPDNGPNNTASNNFRGHFFRVFNNDGTPADDPVFMTNAGYANWSYGADAIGYLPNENVMSVGHFGNGSWNVFANIKDMDGNNVVSNLRVNQSGSGFTPKFSVSNDGDKALIVWTKLSSTAGGSSVWGRLFDLSSKTFVNNEFRISTDDQSWEGGTYGGYNENDNYSISATNDGGFYINWYARSNGISSLRGRKIEIPQASASPPIMSAVQNTSNFALGSVKFSDTATLADGRLAIVYSAVSSTPEKSGVYIRVQNLDGTAVNSDQKISNTLTGFVQPKISLSEDGKEATIVWNDYIGSPSYLSTNIFSKIVQFD